jgi:hypothetical protein
LLQRWISLGACITHIKSRIAAAAGIARREIIPDLA